MSECATEGCAREPAGVFDRGGISSVYCSECMAKIDEGMVERAARVIDPTLWMLFAQQEQSTGEPMSEIAKRSGRWAAAKGVAKNALAAALKKQEKEPE